MTRTKPATEQGLEPHYKVRVVIRGGAILHLASRDEPRIVDHQYMRYAANWINDPLYGDTIGHIDWTQLAAITWRRAA